ncbi:MAG: hypothetical protein RLY71_2978 [Pseudomonadota bacterium]|jgi:hypothetical protein
MNETTQGTPAAPQGPPENFFGTEHEDTALREASGRGGMALEKAMLYLTWLIPVLEGFPRNQRFLLGDRLQSLGMDVVGLLVEATYTKAPVEPLRRVNLLLEQQRLMLRLAYNLRHLNPTRYEFACRKLDEIGRSVGGWLKRLHQGARPGGAYPSARRGRPPGAGAGALA